jgi:hypothetical protein
MKKFITAAVILFAIADTALASPFSDFSARVAEIRQAKHLPQIQIVEDIAALEYLNYLKNYEGGFAISTGNLRVTRWAESAYDCLSGAELPMPAASRADALCAAEEQHGDWPQSHLFDLDNTVVEVAILKTKNGWLIATPRQ